MELAWLEVKMIAAMNEVDTGKRRVLEAEIGQFIFDNALTDLNILTMDAVWPMGGTAWQLPGGFLPCLARLSWLLYCP